MAFDLLRKNCMIDLETLGTGFNAGILSIGAVMFDHSGILDEFYINVKLRSITDAGLTIDPDTLKWWAEQHPGAIESLFKKAVPLKEAIEKFNLWYGKDSMATWSNGANFDQVILSTASRAVGLKEPWEYWHGQCFRTLRSLIDPKKELAPNLEIAHNALHDARGQALHMINMWHLWNGNSNYGDTE